MQHQPVVCYLFLVMVECRGELVTECVVQPIEVALAVFESNSESTRCRQSLDGEAVWWLYCNYAASIWQ